MDENPAGPLRTVDRALVVLGAFTDERPERGVVELARELGLDKSQVQRMLATLAARGFLTVNANTRRYRLGPALLGLGRRAERSIGLDGAIPPTLHDLAHEFELSAVFNVPDGHHYRCAAAVDYPGPLRYSAAIGQLYPGHGGASGHAIFAQLPADHVRQLFTGHLTPMTRGSITSVDALLARHADVREQGVAVSEGEYHTQVMAVAAPVFVAGAVIGSLAIAGAADNMRDRAESIAATVRIRARELTLGYQPGAAR
ncbi:IclR family transcriptional regulator [Prauserella cavernicola]|uniref:IclR family transcriptional regulator n=1 Tax=Prauserella cavernicola TaxID=2800127 RepID=A0A934QQE9_9PSEU|nr:IclR family transcriptional regulator [Prauserella cavernicola]MBK1783814.1 IclR family transcriptional regulator [Prauserella cavernicola]